MILGVLKIVKMFSLASYLRAKNSFTGLGLGLLLIALLVIVATLVVFAGLEAAVFTDLLGFFTGDLLVVLAFVVAI